MSAKIEKNKKWIDELEEIEKTVEGRVIEIEKLKEEFGYANGCIPSPEDNRDIPLGVFQKSVELPKEYFTDLTMFGVNNQGRFSSCVAQSVAQIKEEQELRDIGKVMKFSPRFIYALCKKIDNYNGQGTYLRTAAKIVCDYGVVPNGIGLFDENLALGASEYQDWQKIPPQAFQEALPYKTKAYARVNCDMESIKQAIYQNRTVFLGFTGSNEGWVTGDVRSPKTNERQWGHACIAYGFSENFRNGFIDNKIWIKNSWGDKWGLKGYGSFGKDYMPFECWAITDVPTQLIINAKSMYKLLRVKGDKKVYACKGEERHWIINPRTFQGGHNDGQWDINVIIEVEQTELDKYKEGDVMMRFDSPFE